MAASPAHKIVAVALMLGVTGAKTVTLATPGALQLFVVPITRYTVLDGGAATKEFVVGPWPQT